MWVLPKSTREYLNGLTPQVLSERFDPEQLKGQFVMARTPRAKLSWPAYSLRGWHLAVEPSLPCVPILSGKEELGWILGHAVDSNGKLVSGTYEVPVERLEESLNQLGSRYVAILPSHGRVYLDPCGFLSAVYSPADKMVASTSALIPYSDATADRRELMASIEIPFGEGMYPLGMTSRRGIDRILPNHYLDLNTFKSIRHWPVQFPERVSNPDESVSEIIAITKLQIRAIVESGPARLGLTSGKDSRMLLACARDVVADLETGTYDTSDPKSWGDIAYARRIARVAKVRHRTFAWKNPQLRDLELWLYRTQMCAAAVQGWLAVNTIGQVPPDRASIDGAVGELGRRTQYWRPGDAPETRVSAERLLARCRCGDTSETRDRYTTWLAEVEAADCFQLLDLAYTEQLMGCWGGIWVYGETRPRLHAFPFNNRRTLQLMMQLPLEFRRSDSLPQQIISREWPELLRYPFNVKPAGVKARGVLQQAFKAANNPGKAYRKLLRLTRLRP